MKKLLLLLLIILSLISCGRKTNPKPVFQGELTAWKNIKIEPQENGALNVSGEIYGNYENINTILFELEAINEENSCITCPFKATENTTLAAENVSVLKRDRMEVVFSYTPDVISDTYRLRLQGKTPYISDDPVSSKLLILDKNK